MRSKPVLATKVEGPPVAPAVRQRLKLPTSARLHRRIRRLWMQHSLAEDKRDLDGLMATLTENCLYEVAPTGQRWAGHTGAREFYTTFLGAFPDAKFHLQEIVIGPQGVFEAAEMVGTHRGTWAGRAATGLPVRMLLLIYFPWDHAAGKFAGEKIYYDRADLEGRRRGNGRRSIRAG